MGLKTPQFYNLTHNHNHVILTMYFKKHFKKNENSRNGLNTDTPPIRCMGIPNSDEITQSDKDILKSSMTIARHK